MCGVFFDTIPIKLSNGKHICISCAYNIGISPDRSVSIDTDEVKYIQRGGGIGRRKRNNIDERKMGVDFRGDTDGAFSLDMIRYVFAQDGRWHKIYPGDRDYEKGLTREEMERKNLRTLKRPHEKRIKDRVKHSHEDPRINSGFSDSKMTKKNSRVKKNPAKIFDTKDLLSGIEYKIDEDNGLIHISLPYDFFITWLDDKIRKNPCDTKEKSNPPHRGGILEDYSQVSGDAELDGNMRLSGHTGIDESIEFNLNIKSETCMCGAGNIRKTCWHCGREIEGRDFFKCVSCDKLTLEEYSSPDDDKICVICSGDLIENPIIGSKSVIMGKAIEWYNSLSDIKFIELISMVCDGSDIDKMTECWGNLPEEVVKDTILKKYLENM